MRKRFLLGFTAVLVFSVATLVSAQGAAGTLAISVAEHPEIGQYLTDGEGMTLYLFVQDAAAVATPDMELERMTEGVRADAAQCTNECLANWPPLLAEDGAPNVAAEAEGQLDPELLYIADVGGRQQVVYNGWPLYYYANDTQAGDINGQGANDRWFVVSPEGNLAGEVAGGGAAEQDAAENDEADTDGEGNEVGEPEDTTSGEQEEPADQDEGMDGEGTTDDN